jgi:hypothetical protein
MIRTMRGKRSNCGGLIFSAGMIILFVLATGFGITGLLVGHPMEHWRYIIGGGIVCLFAIGSIVEMKIQLDHAIDNAAREIKDEIRRVGDKIREEMRNLKD